MMPTDDERREAARRRGACPYCGASPCHQHKTMSVLDVNGLELRRTCRNFGGEDGTNGEHYDFACSECGYCCDLPEPNYCPGCGARVVE